MSAMTGGICQRVVVVGTVHKRSVRQVTVFQTEIVVSIEMRVVAVDAGVEHRPNQSVAHGLERPLRCIALVVRSSGESARLPRSWARSGEWPTVAHGLSAPHRRGSVPPVLFFLDDLTNLLTGSAVTT